jgi:tryptophan halogenase
MLAGSLADCGLDPGPAMANAFNKRSRQSWDDIRRFLALHYKFNTRLDTPFWRAAVSDTDLAGAEEFVDYFRENGPSTIWKDLLVYGRDVFGFEGYLAMLVGMNVPARRRFVPDEREERLWKSIQQVNAGQAAEGLTVGDALKVVRSPHWRPRPDFFRYPY